MPEPSLGHSEAGRGWDIRLTGCSGPMRSTGQKFWPRPWSPRPVNSTCSRTQSGGEVALTRSSITSHRGPSPSVLPGSPTPGQPDATCSLRRTPPGGTTCRPCTPDERAAFSSPHLLGRGGCQQANPVEDYSSGGRRTDADRSATERVTWRAGQGQRTLCGLPGPGGGARAGCLWRYTFPVARSAGSERHVDHFCSRYKKGSLPCRNAQCFQRFSL